MKRFIVCLFVLALLIAATGFYRGWFVVDHGRIKDDFNQLFEKSPSVNE